MFYQSLGGVLISLINFGIQGVLTGLIVVVTRRIAGRTDDLHVFLRLNALLITTLVVLMIAHLLEIRIWGLYYDWMGVRIDKIGSFDFAFENYTALGYGDAVPDNGHRIIGPI